MWFNVTERKLIKYGNIYSNRFSGTSFAGNVYDADGLCPSLTTMTTGGCQQPMIIIDAQKEHNIIQENQQSNIRVGFLTPEQATA